ncbi:MAG: phage tail tube protein [Selenomonadaceae bacterium]|nr:phage tail tube protein [Selenomonadaceae bacterium]
MAEINAIRTMEARDVLAAKLATATVTVDGNRYLLFQAKNIEAKFAKVKKEVPILGRILRGNKSSGGNGTGKLTIYHNTALFDDMMKKYKDEAEDLYFDLQVTNFDPTSRAGSQTIILHGCNLDDLVIASFDADGDWLEQEINFTFEDWELPQKFTQLDGMQ